MRSSQHHSSLKERYRALFPHSYDQLDNYEFVRCLSGADAPSSKLEQRDWSSLLRTSRNRASVHLARVKRGPVFRQLRAQSQRTGTRAAFSDQVVLKCLPVSHHPPFASLEGQRATERALREAEICKLLKGCEAVLPLLECFICELPEVAPVGRVARAEGYASSTPLQEPLTSTSHVLAQKKVWLILVFPYMPSGSLADVLHSVKRRSGKSIDGSETEQWETVMREEEVAGMVRRLALALVQASKSKVVHRDLKAENVLVDEQGQVWLADWGLATIVQENEAKCRLHASKGKEREEATDEDETFCGTPAYLSPETTTLRKSSYASDVWALGCLVVLLLTGAPAFPTLRAPYVRFDSETARRKHSSSSAGSSSSDTKRGATLHAAEETSARAKRAARDLLDRIAVGDWDSSRVQMMRRRVSRSCLKVVEGMLED